MKFTPKTKEEALSAGLLEKGNYEFTVIAAKEKESKAGNPMIEILIKIWGENGREHLLYDYLMESVEHKFRHFFYSIGMGEMSEKGEVDCELLKGASGVCKIYIKEDKTGQYSPKNSVADYILNNHNSDNSVDTKMQPQKNFEDDDLPF